MEKIKIKGVSICDYFTYNGKKSIVLDIAEVKSMVTGEVIEYKCYARSIEGYATNTFEVPFATVMRYKTTKD